VSAPPLSVCHPFAYTAFGNQKQPVELVEENDKAVQE